MICATGRTARTPATECPAEWTSAQRRGPSPRAALPNSAAADSGVASSSSRAGSRPAARIEAVSMFVCRPVKAFVRRTPSGSDSTIARLCAAPAGLSLLAMKGVPEYARS